ncbi:HWE histidine kinase domain-containing protein [Paracraurococcus ruber]|uniref:histidine kinase n=2 Tax=Paracraurococcus ruber TaxID=77675 RepID=A0ABS1CWB9_9PROT|nr:HWE histidine kinase domain-containing protein [Paracraurococcus ruber]MBK1658812.1 hypothetical protein [Paracraurococcus ruber]TDG16159.1 GAF domain-containing protein [Paracraurococcus ruber]
MPAFGEADLTNCDREPIHIPGSIQPHGMLLILHPDSLVVLQAAGDPAALLGWTGAPVVGSRLHDLLPAEVVGALGRLLDSLPGLPRSRASLEAVLPGGQRADLILHRAAAGLMLEIEPLPGDLPSVRPSPLPLVQAMLARVAAAPSLREACQAATEEVRRVTGFDRVMVYRFLPDGSGAVIAEARAEDLGSFLDLHYPASDVPQQARQLYLDNWVRLIPDAAYVPRPIEPALSPLTGEPPDLSFCGLRSVSPLHLEYLANMGVRASMSLSLVRNGRLWGLIACHHRTPWQLPFVQRAACEVFAQMVSLQFEAQEQSEDFAERERQQRVHEGLLRVMAQEGDLAQGLIRHRPNLLDFVRSDGVALLIEGSYAAIGRTPEEAEVRALAGVLAGLAEDGVAATDSLPALFPPAAAHAAVASGVLMLVVSRDPRDCILWFRPEVPQTVTWAGNPNKPVELAPDGPRLTPRRSFEAWRETVRGRSHPWRAVELEAARTFRVSLLEVVLRRLDEVARERAKARERQDFLMAELDHRVKNTLANIQALVRHSSGGAATVDGFVQELGRLQAMAQAHSLLARSRWEGAGLHALVEEELRAFRGAGAAPDARIAVEGPDLRLKPKAALALSLALHELATNAAKYGALSVPDGQLRIAWRPDGERIRLDWTETGGPRVVPPARRGFGSTVIERGLAYEVGGVVALEFDPAGLRCRVDMPLRQVVDAGALLPAFARSVRAAATPGVRLRGRRVLVVEDSALVAMELESALAAEGVELLGPAATLAEARALLRADPPDAALLDVELDGEQVFPIADLLAEQGVPLAFATGYEAGAVLPARFVGARVLVKPFRGEEALTLLRRMLAPG